MRVPVIQGIIDRRILVNFHVQPIRSQRFFLHLSSATRQWVCDCRDLSDSVEEHPTAVSSSPIWNTI